MLVTMCTSLLLLPASSKFKKRSVTNHSIHQPIARFVTTSCRACRSRFAVDVWREQPWKGLQICTHALHHVRLHVRVGAHTQDTFSLVPCILDALPPVYETLVVQTITASSWCVFGRQNMHKDGALEPVGWYSHITRTQKSAARWFIRMLLFKQTQHPAQRHSVAASHKPCNTPLISA